MPCRAASHRRFTSAATATAMSTTTNFCGNTRAASGIFSSSGRRGSELLILRCARCRKRMSLLLREWDWRKRLPSPQPSPPPERFSENKGGTGNLPVLAGSQPARLSGLFHKYAHVRGNGFWAEARRERRAYLAADL